MIFTEEHYQYLKTELCAQTGAIVADKGSSALMDIIAEGMDFVFAELKSLGKWFPAASALFTVSGKEWMERYATTIGPYVYIPASWTPFEKACVLVHETEHVLQFNARQAQSDLPSKVGFGWLYLTWDDGRVRFEVEAYRAGQLEFHSFLTSTIPTLDQLDAPLEGTAYLLDDASKDLAKRLLGVAGTTVQGGASPSTESARKAIAILKAKYPELEHSVEVA